MNILIIGGKGKMGAFFTRLFNFGQKNTVEVLDIDSPQELYCQDYFHQFDVILLSVPIDKTVDVARRIDYLIHPDSLLCDISSLKTDICSVYEEFVKKGHQFEMAGFHPMFGPTITSHQGQKIIYCPVSVRNKAKELVQFFNDFRFSIEISTPDEHDKMMAVVQVLVHFSKIVTGETMRMCDISIDRTMKFLSPIYTIELSVIGRLFAQSPELYANIEMYNPYTKFIMEKFIYAAKFFAHIIEQKDKEEFCVEFNKVADYFSDFCNDSLKVTNGLVESISSRAMEILKK